MKSSIAAIALALPIFGSAQTAYIPNGFVTGSQYQTMSIDEQETFVVGVVSGMLVAAALGGPQARVDRLLTCIQNMGGRQLQAMTSRWVQQNPDQWHNGMNIAIFSMLNKSCRL